MNEQQIAGYRVVRRLGGGGMGEVFLVQHPRLPRQDALKLLHTSVSSDPQYKGRFEREAYVLAQLNHRNIIHLYDRGEWGGRLWISMEYVAGPDTHQMLSERGPMPLRLATEIADGAGAGLDYAYRQARITHRDVKPANILVAFDADGVPQVKLADFGIAKAAGEAVGLTSTGITVGTMSYMSPEAFDNRELDNRADLYSLGCTVFELLTGSPPFPGDSPAAVISAHLNQPVPKITSRAPHLPQHLDAVFRKALAKRPEDRYDTCAEFVAGLRGEIPAEPAHTAQHTAPHPTRAQTAAQAPSGPAPSPTAAWPGADRPHTSVAAQDGRAPLAPPPERSRRRPTALIAGALALVVAIAAGVLYLTTPSVRKDAGAAPLTATSVRLLNLQGSADTSPNIDNVLTGQAPPWRTDRYVSGPAFGGLKSGLGLLVTLDRESTVTSGTITSPSAGSTVQVRTSPSSSPSSIDQTQTIWDGTLQSGDTEFTAGDDTKTRYVLVWITGLTQTNGQWSTTIEHVQLRGK